MGVWIKPKLNKVSLVDMPTNGPMKMSYLKIMAIAIGQRFAQDTRLTPRDHANKTVRLHSVRRKIFGYRFGQYKGKNRVIRPFRATRPCYIFPGLLRELQSHNELGVVRPLRGTKYNPVLHSKALYVVSKHSDHAEYCKMQMGVNSGVTVLRDTVLWYLLDRLNTAVQEAESQDAEEATPFN
jgi:hypothetical protein